MQFMSLCIFHFLSKNVSVRKNGTSTVFLRKKLTLGVLIFYSQNFLFSLLVMLSVSIILSMYSLTPYLLKTSPWDFSYSLMYYLSDSISPSSVSSYSAIWSPQLLASGVKSWGLSPTSLTLFEWLEPPRASSSASVQVISFGSPAEMHNC